MNAALLSSEKMDWETPDSFLALVRTVGPIGVDPCTTAANPVGASWFFTPEHDGLKQDWRGDGLVYVNPPYGRALIDWARKMRDESERGAEIIALVPARTDTRWFQQYVAQADLLCFWRGRLTFKGAPAPAPFPSLVAYWGRKLELFTTVFQAHGLIR